MYVTFMEQKKAYAKAHRDASWEVLWIYGVNEKLLHALRSFIPRTVRHVWKSEGIRVKVVLCHGQ